jgi:membrane-associated phospholipid phosphatase
MRARLQNSAACAPALSAVSFARLLLCISLASPLGVAWSAELASAAPVRPGERLSDWLLRNQTPETYLPALQWQVPAERPRQEALRRAVLQGLRDHPDASWPLADREALSGWLTALPVTGRLGVALPDARWLQSAPDQDPVLLENQQVVLVGRPQTVTVLTDTGVPCAASHVPGALIRDYLASCLSGASTAVDEAWLVQPDGRSSRYGVALWNQQPQNEPAPGAWIWAPRRQAAVPESVSDNLARFLATQLPGEQTWPSWHATPQRVAVKVSTAPVPRQARVTASDWGEIGLIQTPTARMAEAGEVRFQLSSGFPYTRGTVMLQPLDWLEAGFRYTDISNRLYGPTIAGNQSLKDKSIDFKVRLKKETDAWPEVALGVRDLGGTGLFSGEYVVASKRWGNFDWSLGLGWGYLAGRGNLKNPLSVFGDSFNTRPVNDVGQGGTASASTYFRGPSALFGGVQWQSPDDNWIAKLELDGNDYQHEPEANNLPAKSPFNLGLSYRYGPHVDLSLGLERGNRLFVGFTLHGGLSQLQSPKLLDPKLPAVLAQAPQAAPPSGQSATVADIERFTGWSVRSLEYQSQTTRLLVETDGALYLQDRIERVIRVLHRDAPASSRTFSITLQQYGLVLSHLEVDRSEWVARHLAPQPPALRQPIGQVSALPPTKALPGASQRPGMNVEIGPSFRQSIGGPDGFILYQLGLQGQAEYRVTDSTWFYGALNARLLDNYGLFKYDAPSDLPRVRTYQREYVTSARLTMPVAQITQVHDLGNGHYASVYAGMLEPMFGGVGGEWLYRPWRGPVAIGADINRVRQRDFNQNLSFRDYGVTTGHATLYWDTGWNDVQLKLSAGRYLAGDVGATLDVKRDFANGVSMGAYATKTNVSAAQFGEGSFDKGVYVTIPFDAMLPRSTPGDATIAWSPLTRDGGARLSRMFPLFDLTRMRDRRALQWGAAPSSTDQSAKDSSYVAQDSRPQLLANLGSTTQTLGQQIAAVPPTSWLWAGGALLAARLMDSRVDQWAQNHATGTWERVGNASSAIPVALALGTGLLYTGIAGEGASQTAETSVKAAAYTLVANLATRWVVGRVRPSEDQGPAQFNGLKSSALQSSFASNHVALAFALATPIAKQYDMPWLYAAAAATAFGRIQQRDHWLSDTVAGGFMGYTIGSLLSDQQKSKNSPRLSVTPQSVNAEWSFN